MVRRSALQQRRGELPAIASGRALRYPRTLWRRLALRVGGFDLAAQPVQALTAVNFRIEKGMVGILGPNGAGKTTLLRQLAGILDPSRGAIALGGAPLGKVQRTLAQWVGYLPQDAGLPGGLSAREYLTYFAALYDLPPAVRPERVEHLLAEVGLAEKADDKIKELSGGMRQRVAVARTLLRLPPVIIVDEPTVGLDPRERIRFRNLLSRLASDRIVLFSTHVGGGCRRRLRARAGAGARPFGVRWRTACVVERGAGQGLGNANAHGRRVLPAGRRDPCRGSAGRRRRSGAAHSRRGPASARRQALGGTVGGRLSVVDFSPGVGERMPP